MVKSLSVVIPAYNEEENISSCIQKVDGVLKKLNIDSYEIIVVNDGSKDRTGEVARGFIKKVKNLIVVDNNPNRGYGGSLRSGFDKSTKDFIAWVPGDNQFDFAEITRLITRQEETDTDIVSGIREGGGVDPLHRRINRWGWNTVVRALFGYLATDIDCGFKLLRREVLNHVILTAERGAMIDTQLFASARARGFTVSETSLTHLPRTAGKSTGANLRVIYQSFVDLFSFWWRLKKEILVERGLAVFPLEAIAIIIILFIASYSRLHNIGEYMTFLGDEGRDARVVRDIVTFSHFPLIGPGTSVGSMYLGPLYYYLIAPSMFISGLSPVGPAILIALIGTMTVGLLWWVGRQWYGRKISLAISLLYSLAPTIIIYSRSSWNPNIMPFFALLSAYGIWKVWKYGYWRWLVISSIALGFVLNSHYLGLILIPFIGLFWLISIKDSKKNKTEAIRSTLISILVLLFLLSPLVLFDMRHDWQNFGSFSKFVSERQTTVNLKVYKALPQIWPLWEQIVASLLTAKNSSAAQLLSILIPILISLNLFITKNKKDLLFTLVWIVLGLTGLGLYKQHIYDHYFGFLFPAVFLLFGFSLKYLYDRTLLKPLVIIGFVLLLGLNIQSHPLKFSPNKQLDRTRIVSEKVIELSNGEPFNLALISKGNYDESYRFFLENKNANMFTIHQKLTNQLFVICEGDCQPINNPLWEVAAFGWAKIDNNWTFPWGVTVYKLTHTQK